MNFNFEEEVETFKAGFTAVVCAVLAVLIGTACASLIVWLLINGAVWGKYAILVFAFVLLCWIVGKFIESDRELSR